MKAKSNRGTSPEEIAKQITECTAQEFNPTLAIVFMPSQKEDTEKMIAVINEKEVQFFGRYHRWKIYQ
jgi:phosphoribosylanthranilate isomerase